MEKIDIKVKGMTCGHCKMAVEKALQNITSVSRAEVDLEKGEVHVEYEPDINVEELKKAVRDAGYEA
ncbi:MULTISPECIES: heavy-metal-associated domain-containing protein [Methanohalophilus]|jgi:copper chaperone|uniref:Copper chaperone n=1 Tax=Methanohalophilus euhalobius TaxID=51203 RepID=A0A285EPH1_9EURY|nr:MULTISPECIES: copper ion binding protein [Methanohalophilus]KXS46913.1 MAG: heavy metal transport/detoxification protein [Methanohalophilus sp. T328-1]RSD35359.1 MAG: heavy metal transport/detoxification protein [Methanohalophilus sp.]OBZ34467.1 MAG: copper resistance protein CopZ [Methanohalophilus sp. DAL1]ODV49464.1 MAG: heavy metal transport/detoxification protein [Methanohalophilus sp. 2-GBenrich]PQV42689.1 copper chaperone [Methanohalophilus euhalobius]